MTMSATKKTTSAIVSGSALTRRPSDGSSTPGSR